MRTEVVRVRLSRRERTALERTAKAQGRKLSETVRELLRIEAQRIGTWPAAGEDVVNDIQVAEKA